MDTNIESLRCIPETNVLCVNFISIKNAKNPVTSVRTKKKSINKVKRCITKKPLNGTIYKGSFRVYEFYLRSKKDKKKVMDLKKIFVIAKD